MLDASTRGRNSSEGTPKASLSSECAGVDVAEFRDCKSSETPVLESGGVLLLPFSFPWTPSSLSESMTMISLDATFKLICHTLGANCCDALTLARFIASALEKKSNSVRFGGSLRFFVDGPM